MATKIFFQISRFFFAQKKTLKLTAGKALIGTWNLEMIDKYELQFI